MITKTALIIFGSNLITFIKTLIVGNTAGKIMIGIIMSLTFIGYIYVYNTRCLSLKLIKTIDSPAVTPCKLEDQDWWDSYSHPMSETSKYKDYRVQPGSITATWTTIDRMPYSQGDDLAVGLKSEGDMYMPLDGKVIQENIHMPNDGHNPFLRGSNDVMGFDSKNPFVNELQLLPSGHQISPQHTYGNYTSQQNLIQRNQDRNNPLAVTFINPRVNN